MQLNQPGQGNASGMPNNSVQGDSAQEKMTKGTLSTPQARNVHVREQEKTTEDTMSSPEVNQHDVLSNNQTSTGFDFEERSLDGQVGLGVDIVEIERMKKILARTPSFAQKVFSEDERAYCEKKPAPEIHYATRFAAKEAVLKALGTGFSEGIKVRDIEVGRNKKGKPHTILHGRAKEFAKQAGVLEIPLSLSYTHHEAVACAMAITQESVRVAEERVDPMEELAKNFKKARSLLDEMDVKSGEEPTASNLQSNTDCETKRQSYPDPGSS